MDMCDELDREDDGPMMVQRLPNMSNIGARAQIQSTAMMQSTDSLLSFKSTSTVSIPDVAATKGCVKPSLTSANSARMSVVLMDSHEKLAFDTEAKFKKQTYIQGCVYVVAVFGNTGEGKSHLLNQTFFGGNPVFRMFAEGGGTEGVHVAFRSEKNLVIVDTEGLLNPHCPSPEAQTRMLFKVLAVSDVVILHSRADRLPRNLFTFLGDASRAYPVFQSELDRPREKGPIVIVNHRPLHAKPLQQSCGPQGPEAELRKTFQQFGYDLNYFSSLKYIGAKSGGTSGSPTKNPDELLTYIANKLEEHPVRERRNPEVVFRELQKLNERFKSKIVVQQRSFREEYLTCEVRCRSCDARCAGTVGHEHGHASKRPCQYKVQFENQVYRCRRCDAKGKHVEVVPKACSGGDSTLVGLTKYLWSGFVLECRCCGVIYRSRTYWYGNPEPNDAVITEIKHVWPGPCTVLQGTHNAGRKVVDGMSYLSEAVSSISSGATSVVSQWVTDQINPSYWIPNSDIRFCSGCNRSFEGSGQNVAKGGKHHCRGCGKGFCAECSRWKRTVPERGWGNEEVRVCEACFMEAGRVPRTPEAEVNVRRKVETVTSTVGTLTSVVLDLPIVYLKDSTRPAYWVPDSEITECYCCNQKFDELRTLHHCRSCGQGVCEDCSPHRRPVPNRGWDNPVRVCSRCH